MKKKTVLYLFVSVSPFYFKSYGDRPTYINFLMIPSIKMLFNKFQFSVFVNSSSSGVNIMHMSNVYFLLKYVYFSRIGIYYVSMLSVVGLSLFGNLF